MEPISQYSPSRSLVARGRPPWAMIIFLASVLFVSQHGLFDHRQKGSPTAHEVVTARERGCISRRVALFSLGGVGVVILLLKRRKRLRINGTLGWLISTRKAFTPRITNVISDLGRNWSFGKWVFASALLWAVSMNLYPWLLAGFHGTAATGVWAACFGIVAIGNPLLFGVHNFLGPQIAPSYAKGGAVALRRFVLKATAVFCVLIVPFCVALLLFGGWLVTILYGDKYAGNGLIVSILALNLLVSAVAFCFSRGLFVIERADVDFKVNFVALFVLLTVGLWMVKLFGPLGAACGIFAGNLAASGVRYIIFSRLFRQLLDRA